MASKNQSTEKYPTEGLARINQACKFLQIGRTKLSEMLDAGLIEPVILPGYRFRRVRWEDLHRLANRKQPAAT